MQGLGALEFVLFGTGAEALASSRATPIAASYGAAVAANIATIAARRRRRLGKDPTALPATGRNPGPTTRSTGPAPRR